MKTKDNLYHFKGVKEETPEEIANKKRRRQKQQQFLEQYRLHRDKVLKEVVKEEINEFINRPSQ